MSHQAKQKSATIYLKDYRAPDFYIDQTRLSFVLSESGTEVRSDLNFKRNPNAIADAPLVLNAEAMEVLAVEIDGKKLDKSQWSHENSELRIDSVPDAFLLSCTNLIHPETNTSLNGLYQSRTMFCSQCEPHGFRRITPYLDRPDVLSTFTVRIEAELDKYPLLLSNGNLITQGSSMGGKHFAEWQDPIPKPAYLFALVAGDLQMVEDQFVTMSGRTVALKIFVEPKDLDKVAHAMTSLKQAMLWDEQTYGREYDLDIFMIVAVDDFNMGAMENKGLNIFNTSAVLANPQITTDARFQWIQAVVGHEYFHNWSGNRVTCRDWFQLSLKEGLTVFRDGHFSSDLNSAAVNRIEDVRNFRAFQFAEDGGPLAHPVQPQSYQEINNFYTMTVYEKGSEIVRMQADLLGPEKFRQATDLYFDRFDGQAVTIEDFVGCISETSGLDMSQFMNWYKQAGTPVVIANDSYDADRGEYRLHLTQSCPPTPESATKKPFVIPVKLGLIGSTGELPFQIEGEKSAVTEKVISFNKPEQEFVFKGIFEKPTPSLLRGFSAPVKLRYPYTEEQLAHLIQTDTDGFNRWDASQQLAQKIIENALDSDSDGNPKILIDSYRGILEQTDADPAVVAMMVTLPSMEALVDSRESIDLDAIYALRNTIREDIATQLQSQFAAAYFDNQSEQAYQPNAEQIGRRSLKNTAMSYWVAAGSSEALDTCMQQFSKATNMTDCSAALATLVNARSAEAASLAEQALSEFYERWKGEALVVNQWFAIQASSLMPNSLQRVQALVEHEAFDITNPNKVRSLIGSFCTLNPDNFHNTNGEGYRFLVDKVVQLDSLNPQTASRMVNPLTRWKRYDAIRQHLMRDALERIAQAAQSRDVQEIVEKSLV